MSQLNFYDPNATLDYQYDTEKVQAVIKAQEEQKEIEQTQAEMETEAAELSAAQQNLKAKEPEAKPEAKPEEPKEDGGVLSGMMESIDGDVGIAEQVNEDGQFNTDTMGGRQRVVAGGIDLAMDAISALIPALKPVDEWWEEKSGRNAGKDPWKKAERDMGGMMIGTIVGGNLVGAAANKLPGVANLSARTKWFGQIAADMGVDALLTGVSDNTREVGNMANLAEKLFPDGTTIPWAGRDSDSPDVTFNKNMLDTLMTGFGGELVAGMFATAGKNLFKGFNDIAKKKIELKGVEEADMLVEAGGDPVIAAAAKQRSAKKIAQINEGRRVLEEDPEGLNGYNAFVNEPAEPIARTTLDESADSMDFMADQARIQNNVGTYEGRSRPLINDAEINTLSRADAATRAELMSKVEGDLGAKFSLTVGDQKVNSF